MTQDDENLQCPDYARLSFPSDKLTMKDLRRLFPNDIDSEPCVPFFYRDRPDSLANLLHAERLIADIAFGEGPHLVIYHPPNKPFDPADYDRALEEEKRLATEKLLI